MKNETVKCHEVVEGKKVFIGEGELAIAESLEDIILMNEAGDVTEEAIVSHFNASRRIEFQRKLKSGNKDGKPTPKAIVAKLEATAKANPELAAMLKAAGFTV